MSYVLRMWSPQWLHTNFLSSFLYLSPTQPPVPANVPYSPFLSIPTAPWISVIMKWRWQGNQSSIATSSILSCRAGSKNNVQSSGLIIQDVSSCQHHHYISTGPWSGQVTAHAGPQWPSFPPAVTVTINSHAGPTLFTPTEITSLTLFPKAPLRMFLDGQPAGRSFSFIVPGYFPMSFGCWKWPLAILRAVLVCKELLAQLPKSVFPSAFP